MPGAAGFRCGATPASIIPGEQGARALEHRIYQGPELQEGGKGTHIYM